MNTISSQLAGVLPVALACGVVILCVGAAASQGGTSPHPRFGSSRISFETKTPGPGITSIYSEGSYSMSGRSVEVGYRWISGGTSLREDRTYAVDYWPTSCNKGPSQAVYVGGKGFDSDSVVIEVWRFTPPQVIAGATPGGGGSSRLKAGTRTSVTRIHDAPLGDGLPRALVGQPGGEAEALLVLFDASRRVYSVNAATGAMTLVMSPDPVAGAILEPALVDDWEYFYVREHAADGFVYVGHLASDPEDESSPSIMMWFDSDKDGDIDATTVLSVMAWQAAGYAKPAAWLDDF